MTTATVSPESSAVTTVAATVTKAKRAFNQHTGEYRITYRSTDPTAMCPNGRIGKQLQALHVVFTADGLVCKNAETGEVLPFTRKGLKLYMADGTEYTTDSLDGVKCTVKMTACYASAKQPSVKASRPQPAALSQKPVPLSLKPAAVVIEAVAPADGDATHLVTPAEMEDVLDVLQNAAAERVLSDSAE